MQGAGLFTPSCSYASRPQLQTLDHHASSSSSSSSPPFLKISSSIWGNRFCFANNRSRSLKIRFSSLTRRKENIESVLDEIRPYLIADGGNNKNMSDRERSKGIKQGVDRHSCLKDARFTCCQGQKSKPAC